MAQVFFIRSGKLIGREHYHLRVGIGRKHGRYSGKFLKQYYSGTPFIPREIMLSRKIEEHSGAGRMAECQTRAESDDTDSAERHSKEKLVELAAKNAQFVLSQDREKIKREEGSHNRCRKRD